MSQEQGVFPQIENNPLAQIGIALLSVIGYAGVWWAAAEAESAGGYIAAMALFFPAAYGATLPFHKGL